MKNQTSLLSLKNPETGGIVYSLTLCVMVLTSFLFAILLNLLLGSGAIAEDYVAQDWYLYLSFLLPQLSFLLVIIGVLKKSDGYTRKVVFRPSKIKYIFLALFIQFGLFSLSAVNGCFIAFLKDIGFEGAESTVRLPSLDGFGVAGALIAVALIPAVVEETLFRGLMLSSMKNMGTVWSVFVCGALFSLFHGNPAQTIYQFVCGCLFALLAIRSGSILPTVLSHFFNNAFVIVMYKTGIGDNFATPVFLAVSGLCLIVGAGLLVFDRSGNTKAEKGRKKFLLYALPGILIGAILWISGLFV